MKAIIYFIILTLLIPTVFAADEPFYLADDQDFAPYIYINKEGKEAGIIYDIVTMIFSTMEQELQYELFPWKRAQKTVAAGIADAMVTIPTKDRLNFLVASEPIITIKFTVHYSNDNAKIDEILAVKTIKELIPFQLVDYLGDGWAEENLKDNKVIWAPSYTSAIGMLALNRVDIFLDDILSIKAHVKKQIKNEPRMEKKLSNIKHGHHVLFTVPLCLLIRKDSQYIGLIKAFNQTLQAIKISGEYQRIIDSHTL